MWPPRRIAAFGARSAVARLQQTAPFVLVQTAPDPVRLAELHRVVETLALDRTLPADRLGARLAHVAVLATFGVGRREEQRRLRPATRRTRPPRVECVDDHGPPPPSECLAARKLLRPASPPQGDELVNRG